MNTMLSSATDLEARIRDFVVEKAGPTMLYAFDITEAVDLGDQGAGDLFEQDQDFFLFETVFDKASRAGPGWTSPRRYWGTMDLTLFTKAPRDKVRFSLELERVADWFQDATINGIRFRSFLPTSTVAINGFTAYTGVINFEFEISLTR